MRAPREGKFLFIAMSGYLALILSGILFHPMWRDEIHFWSIAGASSSLPDLLQRKAWDGHPDLWYIMVYPVRCFTANPVAMQLMHAAIASVTAFLVLRFAPFSRLQRLLLVFGYYFLFEYAVISRNYAPALLLIIVLLIRFPVKNRSPFVFSLILGLMAQTNIFGIILCITFLATWLFELIVSGEISTFNVKRAMVYAAVFLLALAAIAYAVASVLPPPSDFQGGATNFSLSKFTLKELIRSVGTLWRAWFPIPEPAIQFWNTNIISPALIQAILSLILFIAVALVLRCRPVALFFFLTGIIGIVGFIYTIFYGYQRHHGHLFLVLMSSFWLSSYYQPGVLNLRPAFIRPFHQWLKKNTSLAFNTMLVVQLAVGAYALGLQPFVPFSAGKAVASYIDQEKLHRFTIAGDRDVTLETVAGYLDRPLFFFSRNCFSSYMDYNPMNRHQPDERAIWKMADSLSRVRMDAILLVMSYPLHGSQQGILKKLKQFTSSIQGDEIYYLYLYRELPGPPTLSDRKTGDPL